MRKFLPYCLMLAYAALAAEAHGTLVRGATLSDYMGFKSSSVAWERYYYGSTEGGDEFFDIHIPSKIDPKKDPVVVIHGGCWDSKFQGFPQAGQVVDYFIDKGRIVFNVEYTRADSGGGYPRTYSDISNALLKITSILEKASLASKNLAIIGHSAGGHLAVWAASGGSKAHSEEYLRKVRVGTVVALGGILDLDEAENACPNIAEFGGKDRISGPNPAVTSPILMESNAKIVLINGSLDTVAPARYAMDYASSRNGAFVSYRVIPEVTHYDLMSSRSGVLDVVLAEIMADEKERE